MNGRLTLYKDTAGEWRWTLRAANGEIVADSSEGYSNRQDCLDMAQELFDNVEVDPE